MKLIYDKEDIIRLCMEDAKRKLNEYKVHDVDCDSLYTKVTVDLISPGIEDKF